MPRKASKTKRKQLASATSNVGSKLNIHLLIKIVIIISSILFIAFIALFVFVSVWTVVLRSLTGEDPAKEPLYKSEKSRLDRVESEFNGTKELIKSRAPQQFEWSTDRICSNKYGLFSNQDIECKFELKGRMQYISDEEIISIISTIKSSVLDQNDKYTNFVDTDINNIFHDSRGYYSYEFESKETFAECRNEFKIYNSDNDMYMELECRIAASIDHYNRHFAPE